ncbi:MAG TPA: hypothetical protein VIH86_05185, partial [Puia sp.]
MLCSLRKRHVHILDCKKEFTSRTNFDTAFNDEQKIVSQRDIYISKAGDYLRIVSDKKNYGPRQKVNLSISVKNEGNEKTIVVSVLSLSINNNQKVNEDAELSVLRHMINDNIEFPGKNSDDSISSRYSPEQWDLIMLIQKAIYMGWQNSKEKISDGFAAEQSDSEITTLAGRVFEKKNLPAKNRIVTMVFNNLRNIPEIDTTDDDGRFHFKLPENIYDSAKLNFQVSTLKRNPTEDSIVIEPAHLPHFTT